MADLKAWLICDTPQSRLQAALGRAYGGWLALAGNRLAMVGLGILLALVLVAILAPAITSASPLEPNLSQRLQAPNATHWFGTDELGRDIYSRVVYGSRLTFYVITLVAVSAAPLGLIIGTVAGYLGGWADKVLMRLTDIFLAFPRLILALAFVAALGPGVENAVLAIALTAWPPYARVARAETLTLREAEFIAAARLQGASTLRIVTRHIIPLCMSSVVVRVTLDMAGIILTAAGLGFLGLGAQPPLPEWGAMISAGRQFLPDYWWPATLPGLAICLVSLGFNLLGDGLRDALDPRGGA